MTDREASTAGHRDGPGADRGPGPTGLDTGDRDRRLAREGWVRRFVAGPPRLREMTETYERLGYEVRLERPSDDELAAACRGCALPMELYRILYTRRRS